MSKNHILKNLHSMIRNASARYLNEFIWQDIELTEEFKNIYGDYLRNNNYDIEFLGSTAVITSSSTKFIYVPNQWFVIASYAVDVYKELKLYKQYFKKVAERLYKKPDTYAKLLRDNPTKKDTSEFMHAAQSILSTCSSDHEVVDEAVSRLWRFVTDYSWWSGQKTIDRGDFHLSVILNMLNLVNASQSFVADIVSAYANDSRLEKLVENVDGFTVNMETDRSELNLVPDDEVDTESSGDPTIEPITKPERVRIRITGTDTVREIKF